jgi:spore coat polysaccharide biosynthesis protein SpsF
MEYELTVLGRKYKMILGILQARVSSSRLPGKVLKPILGNPMLIRQIERIIQSRLINRLIIATSIDESDDAIEAICKNYSLEFFRGQLNDVLDRFYCVAKPLNPEHVVRLTGDCPLVDPELIDSVIDFHLRGDFDYSSNTIDPTYPDGLDVEVFRFSCLEKAWHEAKLPSQREHVTPFIKKQPNLFKIGSFKNDADLSHLRWTVDELPDFVLVEKIYQALYPGNRYFGTKDILDFIGKHPELCEINFGYLRNEGLQKSLMEDKLFLKNKQ